MSMNKRKMHPNPGVHLLAFASEPKLYKAIDIGDINIEDAIQELNAV